MEALMGLGLSQLEAEVYVVLLTHPSSTGYRVAQQLGKAAAGVYKALDALTQRGAVLVEDEESRRCVAVPPEELVGQIERAFEAKRRTASAALRRIEREDRDVRLHRLRSFEHVVERAQRMLERAEQVAVIDVFPDALPLVKDGVEAAHARGVRVLAQVYRDDPLAATMRVVAPDAEHLIARWRASWLNLVVDAREHLLSFLDCGARRVVHATWTNSAYLSVVYYNGVTSELALDALGSAIERGADADELRAVWDRYMREVSRNTPLGVHELRHDAPASTSPPNKRRDRATRARRTKE
ncbi:MAG: TrmB family transcriptional regulator [Sandaracinaceae bacterium]